MAVAGIERRSPFDLNTNVSNRNVVYEVLGVALIGLTLGLTKLYVQDVDVQNLIFCIFGIIYMVLIFKNIVYGIVLLILAIGLSPDTVWIEHVRLEDFLFPPLLFIWLMKLKQKGDSFVQSEVLGPIKLYMFIAAIVTIRGIMFQTVYTPVTAYTYYFKYLEYFLMFWFVMNNVKDKEDIILMVITSFITCALVAYFAYTHRAERLEESVIGFVRASGPEGETPNVLGGYYMLHIMLGFSLFFAMKHYLYKLVLLGFLMAVVIPLLVTYSRTSFASLLVGLVVTSLFIDFRYLIVIGILFVCAPIFIPVDNFVEENVIERYMSILDIFSEDKKVSSWDARTTGWYVRLVGTWVQAPVFGKGVGSIGLGIDNSYVKKFIETGIVGLLAFFMIMVRIGRVGFETIKSTKDDFIKYFTIGYMGSFVGMLMHAIGVSSFSTIRTAEAFWVLTGMMVGLNIYNKNQLELEEEEEEDRESLSFSSWR